MDTADNGGGSITVDNADVHGKFQICRLDNNDTPLVFRERIY